MIWGPVSHFDCHFHAPRGFGSGLRRGSLLSLRPSRCLCGADAFPASSRGSFCPLGARFLNPCFAPPRFRPRSLENVLEPLPQQQCGGGASDPQRVWGAAALPASVDGVSGRRFAGGRSPPLRVPKALLQCFLWHCQCWPGLSLPSCSERVGGTRGLEAVTFGAGRLFPVRPPLRRLPSPGPSLPPVSSSSFSGGSLF